MLQVIACNTWLQGGEMDLREVMEFQRDRAQLRSNARSRFERRPSQPVSHAVALAGPMIPSLPALHRGSYVRSNA
jgi:hypothetical protein